MCEKQDERIRARRYIRIVDEKQWELIDEISQEEKYRSSFNLIINDALFYGLPMLHEKLFGKVTIEEQTSVGQSTQGEGDSEFYMQVVRLLKEIVLNEAICKSILSSLFNAQNYVYQGRTIAQQQFEEGAYSNTPDYLESFELKGLKELRGNKK
ncbi:MAG: hypothetical protein J1F65_00075 [Clostridiales bacterium]|nr:hypothetical protein [Clostridiales bacterium]